MVKRKNTRTSRRRTRASRGINTRKRNTSKRNTSKRNTSKRNTRKRNTHIKNKRSKKTRNLRGNANRYEPYKQWRGEHTHFDAVDAETKKVSKSKWRGKHTRFDISSESEQDSPSPAPVVLQDPPTVQKVPAPAVLQRESEDPLMNAINKMFDDDPLMKTRPCHHSLRILGGALKMLGKTIEMLKEYPNMVGLQNSQNILKEIISYIKISGHFILYMEGLYHFWLIEILDGKWRFLSQWEGEHDFLKYAESGKYGKFGDLESLSILEDDLREYDEIPKTIDKLKEIDYKTKEIFLGSGSFPTKDLNKFFDSEINGYLINKTWKPRIKKIFKIL
jgi:hypothetical protein